jgi:uncharacterized membrane protein
MIVQLDANELIRLAERELAEGERRAPKTLERARRDLLKRRNVKGLEGLLELAARCDDGGDLTYAIRQNLRFLARRAQAGSTSTSAPGPAPKPSHDRSFLFGDPRRARSLALAYVVSIATFPLSWGILLVLWGLGGGDYESDQAVQHAERVIVVLAAILPAIGLVAASLDWLGARRSYPPETRGALLSREGILGAAAVLTVLAGAVALGVVLWNTVV